MNYQNKFFGSHKIISVDNTKEKIGESKVLKVLFDNGDVWFLPEEELKEFSSDKMVDESAFRERRSDKIVLKFITTLLESGIQIEWVEYILQKLRLSIEKSYQFANNKVWGQKKENVTLYDIDYVLKNDIDKNRRNKPDASGIQLDNVDKKQI
jgi:hypothetical protein